MCGATLTNKLLALAIVEIVVRENQIETARRQRTPGRRQTGNDRETVRAKKLSRDLLGEDCVILKVEDVHGRKVA
jgi:hypothetical protein